MNGMIGSLFAIGLAGAALAVGTPTPLATLRAPPPMVRGDVPYGPDALQHIDLYTVARAERAPLVVYIHGGGWTMGSRGAGGGDKPAHFTTEGYVYGSIGYRFVPQVTVEQQLGDIAAALARLRRDARRYGIDADRIALVGHSSGAHLAAMLATDPRYLNAAGVPFEAVRAVVLIDGAGYNVPAIMAANPAGVMKYYGPAFGPDPARQGALSPDNHVDPPNAPAWLMLYDVNRPGAAVEGEGLAGLLRQAGATVTLSGIADSSHMQLNSNLGRYGDAATRLVDGCLTANLRHDNGFIPIEGAR